jgi:hypothetical protein
MRRSIQRFSVSVFNVSGGKVRREEGETKEVTLATAGRDCH